MVRTPPQKWKWRYIFGQKFLYSVVNKRKTCKSWASQLCVQIISAKMKVVSLPAFDIHHLTCYAELNSTARSLTSYLVIMTQIINALYLQMGVFLRNILVVSTFNERMNFKFAETSRLGQVFSSIIVKSSKLFSSFFCTDIRFPIPYWFASY